MARTSIIKECTEIIGNNFEMDFEDYIVNYYLSYNTKAEKIEFSKVATSETYSDGGIDIKTNEHIIKGWKATIEDYTNLAVMFANTPTEQLNYKFGAYVGYIIFKGI